MTRSLPPEPVKRLRRLYGLELASREVGLTTTTPVFGGASVPQQLEEIDVIRVPTLRGHLRFWWRALYGGRYGGSPRELAKAESGLWGGTGIEPQRSQVEIQVRVEEKLQRDTSPIALGDLLTYALWPARKSKAEAAPRWRPGIRFQLKVLAPPERLGEVENALRAWILFGGYGSRTRRGVGSLTVTDPKPDQWLPRAPSRDELRRIFGGELDLFNKAPVGSPLEMPQLHGARLYHGEPAGNAMNAWSTALGWLREFRQGVPLARNRGGARPAGRSRWPEADRIRRFSGRYPPHHEPRKEYQKGPAWPRAGFGLPILFHFQDSAAEPQGYELRWMDNRSKKPSDRLASPLVVKAMPLADGRFAPIALWLWRAWPGEVVLVRKGTRVRDSAAPFDRLRAPGDQPLFEPIRDAPTLRDAFLGWLESSQKARES